MKIFKSTTRFDLLIYGNSYDVGGRRLDPSRITIKTKNKKLYYIYRLENGKTFSADKVTRR